MPTMFCRTDADGGPTCHSGRSFSKESYVTVLVIRLLWPAAAAAAAFPNSERTHVSFESVARKLAAEGGLAAGGRKCRKLLGSGLEKVRGLSLRLPLGSKVMNNTKQE